MSDTRLLALRYPNRRLAVRLPEIWDRGEAALLINPLLPPAEVDRLLEQLRPHAIEDGAGVTELAGGVAVDDRVAVVLLTSGASGTPKGVELSHAALQASALAYASRLGTRPGQRWLCCLPLTHIGGLGILIRSRLAGTEPVIHDHFDVTAVAAENETTLISLVPTTLIRLLDEQADLSRYSAVLVGGAGLSPEIAERGRAAGVNLVRTYGMTETCGACNFDGMPLDGIEIKVVDEQILVRGPTLMDGYRLQPDLTAEAISSGWLHTADRGRIGPEGKLEVLGRTDDMILTGGELVSATEVEEILQKHPLLADAAVAGIADYRWGQAVAALVVPAGGAAPTLRELKSFVSQHTAGYKAPKSILIASQVPRTESGKVRRQAVRDLLEDSSG
ncbi:MAG TPA: fatty acid--CoA ligase family protein [Actinomycetota bacterium]|nr:fatty acid--CoA ligase family protein [Actinomycetota bacterium]